MTSSSNNQAWLWAYRVAVSSLALGCSSYIWFGSSNQNPVLGQSSNQRLVLLAGYLWTSHKSDRTINIIPALRSQHKHCHWPLIGQKSPHDINNGLWLVTSPQYSDSDHEIGDDRDNIPHSFLFSSELRLLDIDWDLASPWVKQVERDVYDIYVHISFQKFHPLIM